MNFNCPTDGDHPRDGDHPDDFPYSLITILTLLAILETTLVVLVLCLAGSGRENASVRKIININLEAS